jgi:hypothetical protein
MTRDALKLALEALELEEAQTHYPAQWTVKAIAAIKEALARPEVDLEQAILAEREAIYDIVMAAPFNENVDTEPNCEDLLFAMKAMAFSITAAIRKRGTKMYPDYTPGVGWRNVQPCVRNKNVKCYDPCCLDDAVHLFKEKNT